jgi:hypothetical protein
MSRAVHPGSRILTFYSSRIPDPEVKKAPDPGSRIWISNTEFYLRDGYSVYCLMTCAIFMSLTNMTEALNRFLSSPQQLSQPEELNYSDPANHVTVLRRSTMFYKNVSVLCGV